MKILLIGEYSNVHWTLAEGLRRLGHEVTVVSNGDFWKDYPRDIDVSRPAGPLAGLRLWARIVRLLPQLRGYDVVQLVNPVFFELRAQRLFSLYRYLRRHNRRLVLGAFGMDYYWVYVNTYQRPLRYSDFNLGDTIRTNADALKERRDWIGTPKEALNKLIAADADAIVAGLYEYQATYQPLFPAKTRFIPYPIVVPETVPAATADTQSAATADTRLKLFIGISKNRSEYKGTDIMLRAAQAVAKQYPQRVVLSVAEGVPYAQYQAMMDGADAILDQLYSYTPSMNPLLAMSKGIVCVGGGEPENYEILNERELRPIVNVEPTYESVCHELEQLVLHPERLPELKRQSVQYIRRHHDYMKVARQYESLYQELLDC